MGTPSRTHEEFLEIVNAKYGEQYKILSRYISKREKVSVQHSSCGRSFETAAENMIREGRGACPYCKVVWNKRTHEQFAVLFQERAGDEYTLLGEYKRAHAKIKMRHNVCGHIWSASGQTFLSGTGCPACGHEKAMEVQSLGHDNFVKRIADKYGGEFSVLSTYKRAHLPVLMKHRPCGHQFESLASAALNGFACPACKDVEMMTTDKYKAEVIELTSGEYEVLGEYLNGKEGIPMRHLTCGYEWRPSAGGFLRGGTRCPKCAGYMLSDTATFKEDVLALVGDSFEVLSEYKNAITKIEIRHIECGKSFKKTPNAFKLKPVCLYCHQSSGEVKVGRLLEKSGYDYMPQYKFPGCRNIRPLPFDFAVQEDGDISFLIEYHGRQHYEPVEYFGGEEMFLHRHRLDQIKMDYCKTNNIPLIVIPYYQKDIGRFLFEEIDKIKQSHTLFT